ncbi:MAG: nucleotidyl transferase AbiEii/AbiGii toxin family protein [Gammaproteobacteria bacterium]|nr:nucleotidyl transferase AbiEii/AbiGii toxin family protein [Gammaproteobacteria bacterium]
MTPSEPAPRTTALALPLSLSDVLGRTLHHLSPHIDLGDMWLGGGTGLAAKWHHRHSTDIDLFYDERLLLRPKSPLPALLHALKTIADRGEISLTAVRPRGASWDTGDTPVSLYPSVPYNITGPPHEYVVAQGHRVAVEPSADVILKKLRSRMLHSQDYLSRDIYDVVVSHVEDPVATRAAFAHLLDDELAMLRYDAEHQHIHERAGRDIADASYPALVAQPAVLIRYMRLALKGQLVGKELTGLRQLRHDQNEGHHPTRSQPQTQERASTAERKGDTQGH